MRVSYKFPGRAGVVGLGTTLLRTTHLGHGRNQVRHRAHTLSLVVPRTLTAEIEVVLAGPWGTHREAQKPLKVLSVPATPRRPPHTDKSEVGRPPLSAPGGRVERSG